MRYKQEDSAENEPERESGQPSETKGRRRGAKECQLGPKGKLELEGGGHFPHLLCGGKQGNGNRPTPQILEQDPGPKNASQIATEDQNDAMQRRGRRK